MPTTKLKNQLYRLGLPLLAPRLPRKPEIRTEGHSLIFGVEYAQILRRHHVMGSATLLRTGVEEVLIFNDSEKPKHIAQRETFFRVASITKMATALSVMRCADLGMLDPDQPVRDFYPGQIFKGRTGEITCRQLLCHRSGLADPPDLEQKLLDRTPLFTVLEESLREEPGKTFHYSNFGFGLLGCILETRMNMPVSRILEETVFRPLGIRATLDATTLDESHVMPVARILPYHPGQEVIRTRLGSIPLEQAEPTLHYGHTAGSMYIDINSLEKLILCLRDDGFPLLRRETGIEMRRMYSEYGASSPTLKYGLGLLIIEDPRLSEGRIFGHQGFAYGCADGAFWEEATGNIVIFLNGGCSEARDGRLGLCNLDILKWSLRKELPAWWK